MGCSLEPLCHRKRHDKYIFTHTLTQNVRLTFSMKKWVWTSPLNTVTAGIQNLMDY